MTDRHFYISEKTVRAYEAVSGVFSELFKELKELARKKPEATLNSAKVKLINRVLDDVRLVLDGAPDAKYLDKLDDDDLPQYSDAILVISKYEGALKVFKARHYGYQSGRGTVWFIQDEQ